MTKLSKKQAWAKYRSMKLGEHYRDVKNIEEQVFVRDEAGNVTKISPHNNQGEWEYFSKKMHANLDMQLTKYSAKKLPCGST